MESAWKWGTQRISMAENRWDRGNQYYWAGGALCRPAGALTACWWGRRLSTDKTAITFSTGGSHNYVCVRIITGAMEAMSGNMARVNSLTKIQQTSLKPLGHPLTEKTGMGITRGRGSVGYLAAVSPTAWKVAHTRCEGRVRSFVFNTFIRSENNYIPGYLKRDLTAQHNQGKGGNLNGGFSSGGGVSLDAMCK